MRKHFTVVFLLLFLVLPGAHAQDDRLQIVASHSILADVVRNVTGDAADVTSTMPVGADPHSFQPVPSDLAALAEADIVFINGALFEEGLLEAIENADEDMNIIEASACVEILPFGASSHSHDEDHEHEEGEDHEHEEGEDHEHEEGEDHEHEEGEDHEHEEGEDHEHEEGEDHEHEEGEDHEHEEGEDHEHEMGEMSATAEMCEAHYAEMDALHEDRHEHEEGEDHEHEHSEVETLGPLYAIDCGAGHAHDGEHNEEEGDDHEHAHGSCDPHVWMEPHNVMYWTMLIRDTLVELDPANAETYIANAAAYLEEIDALAHDFVMPMVDTLPEENRILITNHESLGYLAARFDFELVGTVFPGGATASDPSAQEVAALIDLIRDEGVPAIFAETTVTDSLVQTIADETGAQVFVLYSGSLSEEGEPAATYVDYIRYNYTTIVEALGGGM